MAAARLELALTVNPDHRLEVEKHKEGITMTNAQRLTTTLTALNLILLAFVLAQLRPASAQGVATVLRAQALEIVDEKGRVRAEIKVLPAQPTVKMPDGTTGYPETVQLRLISSQNSPNVKLATNLVEPLGKHPVNAQGDRGHCHRAACSATQSRDHARAHEAGERHAEQGHRQQDAGSENNHEPEEHWQRGGANPIAKRRQHRQCA